VPSSSEAFYKKYVDYYSGRAWVLIGGTTDTTIATDTVWARHNRVPISYNTSDHGLNM